MLRPDSWVRGRITLGLPDCVVMPALDGRTRMVPAGTPAAVNVTPPSDRGPDTIGNVGVGPIPVANASRLRSEEHTSELQSLAYLVCRLLLEKKKAGPRTRSLARARLPGAGEARGCRGGAAGQGGAGHRALRARTRQPGTPPTNCLSSLRPPA